MKSEGITFSFDFILSEAIFAGHSILTVNGSTPYNAVYGGVPRMLLWIDQIDEPVANRCEATPWTQFDSDKSASKPWWVDPLTRDSTIRLAQALPYQPRD